MSMRFAPLRSPCSHVGVANGLTITRCLQASTGPRCRITAAVWPLHLVSILSRRTSSAVQGALAAVGELLTVGDDLTAFVGAIDRHSPPGCG